MSLSPKRLLAAFAALGVLVTAAVIAVAQPAQATMQPSFKVSCYPTGMAQNDPIVFPGQAGKAHMHTFFGAHGVDENTTLASLLTDPTSQCGSHFDAVDRSAYWIPTLYQNGQAVYNEHGSEELRVYYARAGGDTGAPVAQAFPQGLRMIAGDMHATTPQSAVSYACAKTNDTGNQRGGTSEFLTCNSDETLFARLLFPDCWDGVNLDSANHKSHMAYSSGGNCPADHPVKLPQITFEAWFYGVNGDAAGFSWASGGAYSFHGDVMSAWDTTAAANLVNQCINVAYDCNPLMYEAIPTGAVTQAQIDVQLAGTTPAPATGSDGGMAGMPGMSDPSSSPSAPAAAPTPTPSSAPTTVPTSAPVADAPAGPTQPQQGRPVYRWWGDVPSWASTWRAWLSHLFASWGWGLSV